LVKNSLLKYSVERLLYEANPEGDTFFGATAFNKMIFLLYKRLLTADIDIKLPYYWYLQGSLIEENQFEEDVGQSREFYITSDRSSRKMTRVPKSSVPEDLQRQIDDQIQSLVQNYRQTSGFFKKGYISLLLDDVYSQAPYEFQRTFNRGLVPFLDSIHDPERVKNKTSFSLNDAEKDKIETLLDDSFRVFPQCDMRRIYDTYVDWDDTIRITLESSERQIFPITKNFWDFFCHNLRILQNENLPSDLIRQWDSRFIENVLPKYQDGLEKTRKTLLQRWRKSQNEDREIENVVNKLNFISRNNLNQSDT